MIIAISLFLLLVLAYWILASTLQNQIISQFKDYLQNYPGTTAKFEKAHLSFLRSFPRVRLAINELVFSDHDNEVLKIGEVTVLLNLRKIIGDSIDVEKVVVRDAILNLLTDELGNRTQIFSAPDTNSTEPRHSFMMTSQEVRVYNFRFSSENRAKKNLTRFNVTEGRFVVGATKPIMEITGEFTGKLDSLISRGTLILSNLPVKSDNLAFSIDDSSGTQALEQGYFMVEDLKLTPSFRLRQDKDGQYIDWSVRCENDLNAFLSIINLKKSKDFRQVNPEARATLVFSQQGIINAIQNPYTKLDFSISGARIESERLPYPITDLFISGNYNNGDKHSSKSASIRIDTLHAGVGDSFIQGRAIVNNLKDPQIRAKLAANIDLKNLIKPTGLFSANGTISANLVINSRLNEIEKDGISGKGISSGEILLHNLDLYLRDSTFRIQIADGKLSLEDQLLSINRFYGLLNKDTFYIEGQLSDFDHLVNQQMIKGYVNAGFSRIDLRGFKPADKQDTTSGKVLDFLLGHLSLAINTTVGKLLSQSGEMDHIDLQGKWEESKFSIDSLDLYYLGMNVHGTGQLLFKDNRLDSIHAIATVSGEKVDLREINGMGNVFGSGVENDSRGIRPGLKLEARFDIDTLLAGKMMCYNLSAKTANSRKSAYSFDIVAEKLQYENIVADSLAASGIISGNKTEIRQCDFILGKGRQSLEGILCINKDQTLSGNIISRASGVDVSQLLDSFGNFGQSFLTGDNITGFVSWTADLYFRLDTNFHLLADDDLWKFNFKVTDSELSEVIPVEKALSFIRQKSKEDILVSNLEFSTFYINEKLYFQDVFIKNSVSDMNIFGTYSPQDSTADVDLQLSLSDLLFKSLKKRIIETEEGPLDVEKDKNINLKFIGTVGQHHIKPLGRRELIKQKARMQSQFNEFDVELQKRISDLAGSD
jgi:hypothetical protein